MRRTVRQVTVAATGDQVQNLNLPRQVMRGTILYELVRTILPSRQSLRAAMRTLDFAGRAGTGLWQPAFQRTAAGRAAHVVGLAGAASAAARARWHRPAPDRGPAWERLRADPGRPRVATAGGKHGYLGSSLGAQ